MQPPPPPPPQAQPSRNQTFELQSQQGHHQQPSTQPYHQGHTMGIERLPEVDPSIPGPQQHSGPTVSSGSLPLAPIQYGIVPQQQPTPPPLNGTVLGGDLPPLKPVFGKSLEELYRRDGSAVPLIVYQCLQAVDLYGLEMEGIYRLSGTASHVARIKAMFDHGMCSLPPLPKHVS